MLYQNGAAQLTIEVTETKTSHLVFEADIIYVDLGDSKHFVADYTNNILRIKGMKLEGETKRPTTNLTVIGKDRFYYSFLVRYVDNPKLNYFIEKKQSVQNIGLVQNELPDSLKIAPILEDKAAKYVKVTVNPTPEPTTIPNRKNDFIEKPIKKKPEKSTYQIHKEQLAQAKIEENAHQIIRKKTLYHNITAKHGDIKLKVTGIYHSLEHCYIKYEIQNAGVIPYDIAYTEFGIKEKKRPKRTALNESILSPIRTLNADQKRVLPMRKNRYVAVFPKLAVPKDRILYLEVIEDGRNLRVVIPFGRVKIEKI